MNQTEQANEYSYEQISSIEGFNSHLDKMNQDSFSLNDQDQFTDSDIIVSDLSSDSYSHVLQKKAILRQILMVIMIFILIISFFFFIITIIALLIEIGISFYSVIMMNYIFFVSSIVSYSMAPIYQSLSDDWLNFVFSFTQVILASPLIAFYKLEQETQ